MSITRSNPNTVWLGGPRVVVNDLAASEAITPGQLIETWNSAGVWRVRKHTTAAGPTRMVATEASMQNKGVDDAYALNDLVEAIEAAPGTTIWGLIASGANISFGDKLESAGNGFLRAWTNSPTPFKANETQANVLVTTRIRVEVM